MDENRCKKQVWGSWTYYQCSRKIWKDGYCKQHHPDSVKERERKRDEKWEKQDELRDKYEREALQAECDCRFIGKCKDDPQKAYYCPLTKLQEVI